MSTGEVWNFEQIYRGPDALKYKFSLINTGDAHFYLSQDKIMVMTLGDADPIEVPWMRPTSIVIFEGISEYETNYGRLNNDQCDLVTGGYNGNLKELWWSWCSGSNVCPDVSLVFNLTRNQESADLVDHGFTAFCLYESDRLPTVADWLNDEKVCTLQQLLGALVKEGTPAVTTSSFTGGPTSIWNETENPDLPKSATSLCAMLGAETPEDICRGCVGEKRFVMASAVDRCLKEYADNTYYRERLSGTTYLQDGFSSILESGSENLRIDADKNVRRLKAEFKAVQQTTPSLLYADIGFGQEASCMTWRNIRNVTPDGTVEAGVELRCLTDFAAAQHVANQTRPGLDALFNCAVRGKYVSYRLRVSGTGGGVCFSSVQVDIARAEAQG